MRLIDADALKEDLKETKDKLWEIYNGLNFHNEKQICGSQIGSFVEVIMRINDMPTIDAVPVVHGRWKRMKAYCTQYVCSECGDIWPDFRSNYCPSCGARMDGE